MKRVLVFGTFDGIHKGHEYLLAEAGKYGDRLIVVVARDETVQNVKKRKPRRNENTRLQELQEHSLVDEARLGNKGDKYEVILEIQPDVICLGYDQTAFTDKLEEWILENDLEIEVHRIKAFHPEKYKSSLMN